MRIAIVTTYPPGKGSLNEYAYHFVQGLRQKPEVSEILLLVDELPEGETYSQNLSGSGQVPVTVIPCWRFGAWNTPLRILAAVRRTCPDVVLFNIQFASFGSGRASAALGLLTPALLKAAGVPTTILLHNIMETVDLQNAGFARNPIVEKLMRLSGTLITRLLLTADMMALTVPKYVEIIERKYRTDKATLVPHGSFDDATLPLHTPVNFPLQIMTFGKFGTYKTVEPLIEAYKLLREDGRPDLQLVIAGSNSPNARGYLERARQHYADLPGLHFTGYVAEEDVPRVFGEATVVVFPYTSTTGSSGVLHQAGGYAKAAVLPNLGDLAELITEEGYAGEFFEPGDVSSMAAAIARVLDNPERRRALETQNYLAARGLPMSEIVDWYLLHIEPLVAKRKMAKPQRNSKHSMVAGKG
jgi:glycosyltransferase involved in cell wall biosynthesis